MLLGKPLIAVIEPDTFRGGLTYDIEDLLLNRGKLEESEGQVWVLKWGLDKRCDALATRRCQLASKLLTPSLRNGIEWNRFSAFQDVSIRLIAERLFRTRSLLCVCARRGWKPGASAPSTRWPQPPSLLLDAQYWRCASRS